MTTKTADRNELYDLPLAYTGIEIKHALRRGAFKEGWDPTVCPEPRRDVVPDSYYGDAALADYLADKSEDESIPVKEAVAMWRMTDDGRQYALRIVNRGGRRVPRDCLWNPFNGGFSPLCLFGAMIADGRGFASKGEAAVALREFAKIEGCGWARGMLAAAERLLPGFGAAA